ncbi:hypothetical protein ACOSZF_00995 [Cytobacillus firmus]|uniref:hypothetical protein n=1 Tax=Cytobacillus firmus TaxID=1399 RepID=UPI00157FE917|nr:hypothetical protein [Cytobacillus firmus]MBG9656848.1 hypothetical protein [Cytobacillus firmus]MED1906490.1 hypothetical protein [Cytobacillus firmus]NUH82509.1 hypothetical protein [Cytobacillus firmus]
MSLKSIELQIALPRTFEAGKIQDQLQQRGQTISGFAADSTEENAEKQRKTVIKQEHKQNVNLGNDDSERQKEAGGHDRTEDRKKDSNDRQNHPYKGKVIDYSG